MKVRIPVSLIGFCLLLVIVFVPSLYAGDEALILGAGLSLTGKSSYDLLPDQPQTRPVYDTTILNLFYDSPYFDLFIDASLYGDEKYNGSDDTVWLQNRYIMMDAGYVDFSFGPFSLRAGRSIHRDQIASPYSLFISSMELPALLVNFSYRGERFFYENRWINLNDDSRNIYTGTGDPGPGVYWVDRGMNYKLFGVNAGDWRFGFQDTVVYLNTVFDPEYFFSPFPMYFTQIITAPWTDGRPWGEFGNVKSFMGLFAERETDEDYLAAQFLLDDVNGSFLPFIEQENFHRLAWSIGGRKATDFGTFGFYHAGATKYTFQATYADETETGSYTPEEVEVYYNKLPYDYTYYPASTYMLNGYSAKGRMPLHYQENYIGYKYGENNLAFLVDWSDSFFRGTPAAFDAYVNLEWVLNGAKAPNNPWHEGHDTFVSDLDGELLTGMVEHIVRSSARVAKPVGDFVFTLDLTLGYIFNAMELKQPPGVPAGTVKEAYIFYPQEGNHRPLFMASLGATWKVDFFAEGKGGQND
jgi:hypothetical protein